MELKVESIKKLEIKKGNVLVVTLPEGCDDDTARQACALTDLLAVRMGIDIMVVPFGTELSVISRSPEVGIDLSVKGGEGVDKIKYAVRRTGPDGNKSESPLVVTKPGES